ncbi:beta strand repeat-containing protein [Mesorhizobium qingshengii]|uniref:beta strand repeat-containing protein n=1 Tax=Mesorhizobium qingshengii TaxID=1165689 RepID=UPI00115F7BCF|nr:Ig-like domain-containing protein [Mesorhizobium qingshengii]
MVVTDADGDSAPAGNLVINIVDDVPTAHTDMGNVNEGALLSVTAVAGVLANDVAGADGATIDGVRAAGGNTTTAVSGGVNTDIVGQHGTLHLNADGSYTYQSTANSITSNTTDVFVYTLKDGDGDLSTTTLTINLADVNAAPVVADTQNWMSSDPGQQTLSTPTYPDGYPLLVTIPTDADGDNLTVTATGTIPTGVFYLEGGTYHALTTGTVLYNPSAGINLLDDLVYRPTATVTDTVNKNLSLDVYDGTTHVTQTVGIHEVPPTSLPSDTAQVGDGSSPLTSGNDQVTTLTLSQATVNAITADPHGSTVVVYTDFQQSPFDTPIPSNEQNPTTFNANNAGSHREQEVQVEIVIGTNHFAVVEDDLTAGTFEQSWFYDPATGLMKATVDYDHIFLLDGSGNATTTTLASYLVANPPTSGDTWTLSYLDNNGGNYQARLVKFSFFSHDPGDPGITVNGDATLADQIYGTSGIDHLLGGGGNDIIVGRGGNDFLNGGGGNDTILAGDGDDTIIADQNDLVIDGGVGTGDTLQVGANFTSASDSQITGIENVLLTAAATLNLSNQAEGFVITGSSGADSITGGSGNDTIVGTQNDTLLAGGGGTDTLQIGTAFTSTSDAQITGIETIQLTSAATLNLSNQTEGFKIIGSSGIDTITGGSGADTINAGAGNDTVTGGGGADQFRLSTSSGLDKINDYTDGTDKIGLLDTGATGSGSVNFANTTGTSAGVALNGSDFVSRTSIGNINTADDNHVISISAAQTATQIAASTNQATDAYVLVFNSTTGRGELWFDSDWSSTGGRTQIATFDNITTLGGLTAITAADIVVYNSATDPIILDLNHDGFAFSDVSHGVQFDINGDGTKDQVAWNTSNDGMLAVDLNHDGKIDDGTELFTPTFGGGNFASGAAALASLDSNHDGVIDHDDAAFSSLLIWKDANANGTSDAGELSHLADNGIVSISLAATATVGEIDGQTVTGNGTFQMADGTTGNYVEVELDTSLVAQAQPSVATDGSKTFTVASLEVTDLIADFHDGANGDKIDLTALLKGLAGVTDLEAGGFVQIEQSSANAANAEVKVDTDGGGDNYHTVAVLENYTFHSATEAVKILYDDSHGTKQDVA